LFARVVSPHACQLGYLKNKESTVSTGGVPAKDRPKVKSVIKQFPRTQ